MPAFLPGLCHDKAFHPVPAPRPEFKATQATFRSSPMARREQKTDGAGRVMKIPNPVGGRLLPAGLAGAL